MTIQFKKVSKRFGQKDIFNQLSFKILAGEKVRLQGPSGIGKSTLFKLILGFEAVDSGEILFNGQVLTPIIVRDLRQMVAYVPQDINLGQAKTQAIIEEIMSFRANANLSNWSEKLPTLLEQFDLGIDILKKDFPMLSGGEKQRIAIIIALLLDRKIFLLDEPTAALDPLLKQKVIQYLSDRTDTTLLIISHDKEWQQLPNIRTINLVT